MRPCTQTATIIPFRRARCTLASPLPAHSLCHPLNARISQKKTGLQVIIIQFGWKSVGPRVASTASTTARQPDPQLNFCHVRSTTRPAALPETPSRGQVWQIGLRNEAVVGSQLRWTTYTWERAYLLPVETILISTKPALPKSYKRVDSAAT